MKLIGMLDSPFVRRVAVSLALLELPYEHADWSVGRDFERIRAVSPLGRVPVLVLPDGEALIDSAVILDYLDDLVGPSRALLPPTGAARRHAQFLMAYAIGAADKGREQIYENAWRPPERRHGPWLARVAEQMHGALGVLEALSASAGRFLVEDRLTQAEITLACAFTFLADTVLQEAAGAYPALAARVAALEAGPAFKATHRPFFTPGR